MKLETKTLGAVGVELLGIDLRNELPESTFLALRSLVVEEGLVLLRNQPLEPEAHVALGRRFGELENLDPTSVAEHPGLVVIGNVDSKGRVRPADDPFMKLISINEGWHTDSSFRPIPASFSLFSAVVVPKAGGDTYYASLRVGWEALGEAERVRLEGLWASHDYAAAYRARGNESGAMVGFDSDPVSHPVVRRHSESGRPGLYISEHVAEIEGLDSEESRVLLNRLLGEVTRAERIYRHRWQAGDFMIWDNRSMLHRAQGFDSQHARVMHHVRVAGDAAPVAFDA